MAGGRARFSLVEYGAPVDLCKQISEASGLERARASQLLIDAGARAAASLGLAYSPLTMDGRGVRAIDFAGLIRLSPSLELEVAPKFLGMDANGGSWREDFFYLSTLSKHGHLLAAERLSSSGGAPRDLATLVARALAGMYEARKRRPLRSYRRVKEADFFIDDDPDPVDLLFPGPDGFDQERIRFDRGNAWNAAMRSAAQELLVEVADPDASSALARMIGDLAPQSRHLGTGRKPIPSRHRAWKPVHELSLDVLKGLGLNYDLGSAHAPGYLVSTWRVWEDLLTIAARLGFGRDAVAPQQGFEFGTRRRPDGPVGGSKLSVFPDLAIKGSDGKPRIVLDAKYKGHIERGPLRIAEADVYEAYAFAKGTGCDVVALAYPAPPDGAAMAVGSCACFERISVGDVEVVGVQVEVRGISQRGALKAFASNLAESISALAPVAA